MNLEQEDTTAASERSVRPHVRGATTRDATQGRGEPIRAACPRPAQPDDAGRRHTRPAQPDDAGRRHTRPARSLTAPR
jgi:hypothetical protein